MPSHARENLLRLMAAGGLSLRGVVERTGLDARTVRGVLRGTHAPHPQTLHRLAQGLGVAVDEFFIAPAQLLYRRFDRQTNPVVAEVVAEHKEIFEGWNEADFDELHSRVGEGGALTAEGTLAAAKLMNRRRKMHDQLDLLMESSHAELIAGIIELLYEKTVVSG